MTTEAKYAVAYVYGTAVSAKQFHKLTLVDPTRGLWQRVCDRQMYSDRVHVARNHWVKDARDLPSKLRPCQLCNGGRDPREAKPE